MEIKGSATVRSIQTVGLRTNEGFSTQAMTADVSLTKYAKKHLYYYVSGDHTLTLPTAQTLDNGWIVSIYSKNESSGTLFINDFSGTQLFKVSADQFVTLALLDNTNTAGVWKNIATVGGGGGVGGFRNVVTFAYDTVLTANSGTATIGNFKASVADGFDERGTQLDVEIDKTDTTTISYTPGTAAYFYVNDAGTILKEDFKQVGGEKLNDPYLYPEGSLYYSISDGVNYKQVDGAWVKYPCVAVGEIDKDENVLVYGFNFWWWLFEDLTSYSQIFYDATYAISSIQLNYPCPDKNMLTVIVGNTLLMSNAYTYNETYSTITFQNPISAGTYIEVRWYVPLTIVGVEGSGDKDNVIKSYVGNTGNTLATGLILSAFKSILVFKNGVLLEHDGDESGEGYADYYLSGNTVIFHTPLVSTDKVTLVCLGNGRTEDLEAINFVELSDIVIETPS